MAATAAALAFECKGLLIGEGARSASEFSEITRVFIEAQGWTAHLRSQTTSQAEEPDQEA